MSVCKSMMKTVWLKPINQHEIDSLRTLTSEGIIIVIRQRNCHVFLVLLEMRARRLNYQSIVLIAWIIIHAEWKHQVKWRKEVTSWQARCLPKVDLDELDRNGANISHLEHSQLKYAELNIHSGTKFCIAVNEKIDEKRDHSGSLLSLLWEMRVKII